MTTEELDALEAGLDGFNEDWEFKERRLLIAEVRRLRAALAETLVPIEVLTAAGADAWELAPEVRGELMIARTLGRVALFGAEPATTHEARAWKDWSAGAPIVCSLTDPCDICKPAVDRWRLEPAPARETGGPHTTSTP